MIKKRILSDEKLKKYMEILPDTQIARLANLSRERIRQLRHSFSIPSSSAKYMRCSTILNEDKLTEIIKRYEAGECLKIIAKSYNISLYGLWYNLKKYGWIRKRPSSLRKDRPLNTIKNLILDGNTKSQVSRMLNIPPASLGKIVNKLLKIPAVNGRKLNKFGRD